MLTAGYADKSSSRLSHRVESTLLPTTQHLETSRALLILGVTEYDQHCLGLQGEA